MKSVIRAVVDKIAFDLRDDLNVSARRRRQERSRVARIRQGETSAPRKIQNRANNLNKLS